MIKFPCKNCEERTVEPNCHMTCEKYLLAVSMNQKHKAEEADQYRIEAIEHRRKKRRT